MDNLAHKMLHTFEKMDAINPTFELIQNTMKDNLIHDWDQSFFVCFIYQCFILLDQFSNFLKSNTILKICLSLVRI